MRRIGELWQIISVCDYFIGVGMILPSLREKFVAHKVDGRNKAAFFGANLLCVSQNPDVARVIYL